MGGRVGSEAGARGTTVDVTDITAVSAPGARESRTEGPKENEKTKKGGGKGEE